LNAAAVQRLMRNAAVGGVQKKVAIVASPVYLVETQNLQYEKTSIPFIGRCCNVFL
jgi:hypothetical protein